MRRETQKYLIGNFGNISFFLPSGGLILYPSTYYLTSNIYINSRVTNIFYKSQNINLRRYNSYFSYLCPGYDYVNNLHLRVTAIFVHLMN